MSFLSVLKGPVSGARPEQTAHLVRDLSRT